MDFPYSTDLADRSQFDVVIVGSGPGGASMAYRLSGAGLSVLVLERGSKIPQEPENAGFSAFNGTKYADPTLLTNTDFDEKHVNIGGKSKYYGAALCRLRERDFEEVVHEGGISPRWPLRYSDLEPYYTDAESLYHVRGSTLGDFTEPPHQKPYPHPPLPHEPFIKEVIRELSGQGVSVSTIPRSVDYGSGGACTMCSRCDGYACPLAAKWDAETAALQPAMRRGVRVVPGAQCLKIVADGSGRKVDYVEVLHDGKTKRVSGGVVALACGVQISPKILLMSKSNAHPRGLSNGSGAVGRFASGHNNGIVLAGNYFQKMPIMHQKTFSLNDWYWNAPGWKFPLGIIQATGQLPIWLGAQSKGYKLIPSMMMKYVAARTLQLFIMSELLPDYESGMHELEANGKTRYKWIVRPNNLRTFHELRSRTMHLFRRAGFGFVAGPKAPFPGHMVGTLRMGTDPSRSIVDPFCRSHEVENLYVVDSSVPPTAGAVNTALTVMALSMRAADDVLKGRNGRFAA